MANCCYSLMDRNEPGTLLMPRQGAKGSEEFMVVIEIPNAAQLPREILADVVRLRSDVEWGVALAKDERGLPAGRGSADRVPDVGRDQADAARFDLECGGNRVVGLGRWLVASHGLVDAETPLEGVD